MQYLHFALALFMALPSAILAGDMRFFAEKDCNGDPTFRIDFAPCGTCITPDQDSSAVAIENISNRHYVTIYNKNDCAGDSLVMDNFGVLCGVQGANKIRSAMIHCLGDDAVAKHRRRRSTHF